MRTRWVLAAFAVAAAIGAGAALVGGPAPETPPTSGSSLGRPEAPEVDGERSWERVPPEPVRERRVAAAPRPTSCKEAGFQCRSSPECCAGLACVGGVAGYGTPGRCTERNAR